MNRALVLCGLALALACPAQAGDLSRYAAFTSLHGANEDPGYEVAVDRPLRGGLQITGEKILLENGNFTASVQKVGHQYFVMSNVTAQGRMPLNDAFFADPITAAVNNILDNSKTTIGSFKNLAPTPEPMDIDIKDMQMTMAQKVVTGSMKVMVLKPEFKGKGSYDKATKKMTVAVESVTMGGINVPLDLAFYVMGQVLNYPFVQLQRPNVIIDLTPFLPNLGVTARLP
jgi:hypothetical protein